MLDNIKRLLRKYLFDAEILRLMALVVLVKPLGLITQVLLAKYFGAGIQYDAYALSIFVVMYLGTVLGNVFTSVVIPYIIRMRSALSAHELMGFQNAIIALFALPALLFAAMLFFSPGLFVDLIGPSLPEETRGYAVRMIRVLSIPGILVLAVAMGKAVLGLNRKFRLATTVPIVNAAITLLAIAFFHNQLGIWSIALGFVVSHIVQTVLLWGRALASGDLVLTKPSLPPGTMGKLWSLSRAIMLAQAILLLYQFIDKMFASSLEPGSISSLTYALTIKMFGVQLFSLTLVTVMFTKISEMIAENDLKGCGDYIRDNIGRATRLLLAMTLVLCLSSEEIVRVLFQRGAFTAADAERTANVMSMYILGLPVIILNLLISRVFHSLQRMKEKVWLAVQYLVTNVIGNFLLIGSMKVMGLALASTITLYLHFLLSLWVLHQYRLGLGVGGWLSVIMRNYAIGALVYLIYAGTGFGRVVSDWSISETVVGDLTIVACKGAFVCTLYGIMYLAWRNVPTSWRTR